MIYNKDLVFGIRSVIEAIKSGKEVDKVLIKKGLNGELFQELFSLIKSENIPYQHVPIEKIDRVTKKNHQGVIAYISEITYSNIENLVPMIFESGKTPLLLILDQISDVRNFGAICRTAECSGVDAIIIPHKGSAQINADAIKTSAGALHTIPVCRSNNLKDTIKFLKNSGIQIVSASEKSEDFYYDADFTVPTAIIMGSEEKGVYIEFQQQSDKSVKIPIVGKIESLNVSVATAVIIYEAVRQRSL